ncbi:MAG: glycosyltransferase family 2 protein, partial [Elusimicrobiota bacterium]
AGKLEEEAHFLDRNPGVPLVFSNFENFSGGRRGYDFLRDHGPFHRMPKILLGGPVPAAAWGDRNSEFRGNGAGAWYRIRSDDAYETLIPDTFIGTSSVMFRKHLAEDVGYFDETLCNSDDVDFFFRVARAHDIGYIDKILHRRRLHGGNISSRPAALRARLRVYERQKSAPLSPKARRDLDRFLASVLFSIGYAEKLAGRRSQAVHYYLESLRRRRANPAAGLAILKALVS